MVNTARELRDHRALVAADKKWNSTKRLHKQFKDRYAFFAKELGSKFATVGSQDAWRCLLVRAKKEIAQHAAQQADVKKVKKARKTKMRAAVLAATGVASNHLFFLSRILHCEVFFP